MKKIVILAAVLVCVSGLAQAGTIVSRLGDPAGAPWTIGESPDGELDQTLAVSWRQGFSVTNWSVQVYNVANLGAEDMTAQFALLMDSPTGPPVVDENGNPYVATPVVGAGLTVPAIILFEGLNLAPGKYYIVASAENFQGAWLQGDLTSDFAAPAAAFDYEWLSNLQTNGFVNVTGSLGVGFEVTGDAGAVPEPGTYLLVGLGLAAIGLFRRRRA